VSRTIEGAGDFHLAMVDLVFPPLTLPSAPVDAPGTNEPSWVDKEQYKLQYSEYIKKMDKRSQVQVQAKVFPLVLGQCSRTIHDCLEASPDWNTINTSSDVLELLKLIQYTKSTNHHPTHALYKAEAALIKFHQGDDMSNSDFLEKFKSLLDISSMPVAIPVVPLLITTTLHYPPKTLTMMMLIINWPSNAA
jgi:hypothetical protein